MLGEIFGNYFIVANVFRDKSEPWFKISGRDSGGLRKFSDFLKLCNSALMSINCLTKILRRFQVILQLDRKLHAIRSPP